MTLEWGVGVENGNRQNKCKDKNPHIPIFNFLLKTITLGVDYESDHKWVGGIIFYLYINQILITHPTHLI